MKLSLTAGFLLLLSLTVRAPAVAQAPPTAWVNVTGNVGGGHWGYAGVCALAVVPGRDEVIAGVSESGLWDSVDGGQTWRKLGAADKEQIICRPYQIVFDPRNSRTFWVSGCYGPSPFRTDDGGATFRHLGTLAHEDGLAVDFSDPQRRTLLVGLHEQDRSLQKSEDGGQTWIRIGTALPDHSNFNSDPVMLDGKTWIVNSAGWKHDGAWGIYRTTDRGATWAKVSDSGPSGPVLQTSDGALYWPITWGGGLIKSGDRGVTWHKLDGPAKTCPVELARGLVVAVGGSQVYLTRDGGKSWAAWGPPLPWAPSGLTYSPKHRCLYAWRSSPARVPDAVLRADLPSR